MKKLILVTMPLLVMVLFAWKSYAEPISIVEMAITTKISKGKPIDSVHRISNRSVRELYCFTRTVLEEGSSSKIHHVWIKDGVVIFDKALPINAKRWRTASSVSIGMGSIGNWQVEARDETGKLLKAVSFRIN